MRSLTITKDLFFLSLVFGGVTALTFTLLRVEKVDSPESSMAKELVLADVSEVASAIDSAFAEEWASSGLVSAGDVDNLLVARRISLGIAGTIPSLAEIREFETKRDEIVARSKNQ